MSDQLTPEVIAEGLRLDTRRQGGEWWATHHPERPRDMQPEHWTIEAEVMQERSGAIVDSLNRDHVLCPDEDRDNINFLVHAANHYGAALRQLQAQEAELERLRTLATRLAVSCRRALRLVEENNEEVVQMVGSFGLLSDLQSALAEAANLIK